MSAVVPTNEQICLMCHLSAECPDCCAKCKKGCQGQVCGLMTDPKNQISRWGAWMDIVKTDPRYAELYSQYTQGAASESDIGA